MVPGRREDDRLDPHVQPRLNFDILRLVYSYLNDVSDVLSVARTCSALTEDAFRRRLSMSTITLSNGEAVHRFHAFIFSNRLSRAQSIYGLKLPTPSRHDVQAMDHSLLQARLVAILKAAVRIQYFYFSTSIGHPVLASVTELATLRELHAICNTFQSRVHTRLITLRSPLRSLRIEETDPIADSITASFLHRHLNHFAPTLEALDLNFFPLNIPPSSITTQFTEVRSLKFRTDSEDIDFFDFHPLAILLRLFPNLDDTLVLGPFYMELTDDELSTLRAQSKEEQTAHAWRHQQEHLFLGRP